jgi:hypothetical protein
VAGGEEVDAGLAGEGHRALGRLAGDERVQALVDRILEVVGAGPGDEADRPHPARPVGERERLAARRVRHAVHELGGRDAVAGEPRAHPDGAAAQQRERLGRLGAQRRGEERVVAVLEVGVERQVVGGQAHVRVEQDLQPSLRGAVERAWRARPEEPVVDEDEVGLGLARTLEELEVR